MEEKKDSLLSLVVTVVLFFIIILLGILPNSLKKTTRQVEKNIAKIKTPPSPSPANLTPIPTPLPVGIPTRIEIPKIKLQAEIVSVKVTPTNTMDIPENAAQVGWFEQSARPGQWGTAVLNGHYDTPSGRAAIFYRLGSLAKGDEIVISTDKDERFLFKVEKVVSQSEKTLSRGLTYSQFDNKELRLITCGGVWDPKEKTYSKRLVVFAQL